MNTTNNKNKLDLLYRIAVDYYELGMIQEEIAQRENISRSHVSRLLEEARRNRIVSVTVNKPDMVDYGELKNEVIKRTGIEFIEVVETPMGNPNSREIALAISVKASQILPAYLKNCKCIGVGGGKTVWYTSRVLRKSDNINQVIFVPLIGVSASEDPAMQTNSIVERMTDTYNSGSYFTNIPIVVDSKELQGTLFTTRLQYLQEHWDNLDAAIIGLGPPYVSQTSDFLLNEATEEYRSAIASSENVGDILASYFEKDGTEVIVDSKYKKISISLKQLTNIDKVLCLAGGVKKAQGIYTAIKKNYINGLVTDAETAEEIIKIARG